MNDRQQEALCAMALTRISYFNLTSLRQLYDSIGSATEIIAHRNDIRDVVPDAAPRLV
jgi:DNA processing protein